MMSIFKNPIDAEKAIMKLLPVFTKNVEGLSKVGLEGFKDYTEYWPNTYRAEYVFYVDGDSFDQDTADKMHALKNKLNDAIKKYLGITLMVNSSSVKTLDSSLK